MLRSRSPALWKIFGARPERALQPEVRCQEPRGDSSWNWAWWWEAAGRVPSAWTAARFSFVMGLSGSGKSTLVRCPHQAYRSHQGAGLFRRRGHFAPTRPPNSRSSAGRRSRWSSSTSACCRTRRCAGQRGPNGLEIHRQWTRRRATGRGDRSHRDGGTEGLGALLSLGR